MIYKEFKGKRLSQLGFGAMRLPHHEDSYNAINKESVAEMVAYAMANGINYYDTAWGYHGGNSEIVMGEVLKAYDRSSFYLASKFPGYDLSNMGKVEEIFETQLKKCQVEHFDFYLIHNVNESNIEEYLNATHGILPYLRKQKESGRIKHFGFSAHGSYEVIERFLDMYGPSMEFGQLQINWIDWEFQKAREKMALLTERALPVVVMEPLRGGSLASLPASDEAVLKRLRPDESVVAWAFRFLQTLSGAPVILSGMSNLEQLKENIAIFQDEKPLDSNEVSALMQLGERMVQRVALPCTACAYCVDECPQELAIPTLLELYNERLFTGKGDFIASTVLGTFSPDKRPSACIACKSCERVCPQQLGIADAMKDFAALLA